MYKYDQTFYDYISTGSRESATQIVPYILNKLNVDSVLDVGCGAGAWLEVWKKEGAKVTGLDGDYVDKEFLYIDTGEFVSSDLSQPFDLQCKFSLVQSLEVAEHLPTEKSEQFIDCLCNHADKILFSAAPPGQGGDNHINEQSYDFWRGLFKKRGFVAIDCIRPFTKNNDKIKAWYRYNTFLYVKREIIDSLPEDIQAHIVKGKAADISPKAYQLRKAFIRTLPISFTTKLAKLKENVYAKLFKK